MRLWYQKLIIVVIVSLLAVLGASTAFAKDFSADMVSQFGQEVTKGKIYVSDNVMRLEAGRTTIYRIDKKTSWILMPAEKMYMEQSLRPEAFIPNSDKMDNEIERTLVGTEDINGVSAKKYRVVIKNGNTKVSFFLWIDSKADVPLKAVAEDGRWWQEYKNHTVDIQYRTLFEVPDGYKSFSMGGWW